MIFREFSIPRAVGIGSFNRVPGTRLRVGPREQRSPACFPTRGALPTRLNECAILNRARYKFDCRTSLVVTRFIGSGWLQTGHFPALQPHECGHYEPVYSQLRQSN
jgi:hypothetical protein